MGRPHDRRRRGQPPCRCDLIVGDVDGVVVVPRAQAEAVLKVAEEIDARELEQAKLIMAEKSLRKGLAKYGRI